MQYLLLLCGIFEILNQFTGNRGTLRPLYGGICGEGLPILAAAQKDHAGNDDQAIQENVYGCGDQTCRFSTPYDRQIVPDMAVIPAEHDSAQKEQESTDPVDVQWISCQGAVSIGGGQGAAEPEDAQISPEGEQHFPECATAEADGCFGVIGISGACPRVVIPGIGCRDVIDIGLLAAGCCGVIDIGLLAAARSWDIRMG